MKVSAFMQRIETLDVSDELAELPMTETEWLAWLYAHQEEPIPFELTPKALAQ